MIAMSDNSPQETKMTQKLTIIGNHTAFNNEQSPNPMAFLNQNQKFARRRENTAFKRPILT